MKTIYTGDIFEEMSIMQPHPEGFRPDDGMLIERMVIPEHKGFSAIEDRVISGGFMVIYQQLFNVVPIMMEVVHDFPFLTMIFELEGYGSFESTKPGMPDHEIPGGMHRLMFLPHVDGNLTYAKSRRGIEISLSIEFFNSLFEHNFDWLGAFGKGVEHVESVLLTSKPMPITLSMHQILNDIIHCKFNGHLKRIYLQSKIAELLIMQLDQVFQDEKTTKIKKVDRDKIFHVKFMIETNILNPLIIPELARQAGINASKLKQLFKLEFGTTIFGYLTDLRLNMAKQLLEEGELPIGDIAYKVGYRHPQHFTFAFKRKFGFAPSRFK